MPHDRLNRLTRKDITPGIGVSRSTTFESFAYDGMSRPVLAEDDDSRISSAYDSLGNAQVETLRIGTPDDATTGRLVFAYDGVGNPTATTYPGGRLIEQTFDLLGRTKKILDVDGLDYALVATYGYAGTGRVRQRTLGNGTQLNVVYDGLDGVANRPGDFGVGQVARTTHTRVDSGQVIDDRAYTWDRHGNKTSRFDHRTQVTHSYAYDQADRLGGVTVMQGESILRRTSYKLDGVNNRWHVKSEVDDGSGTLVPDASPFVGDYDMRGDNARMNRYAVTPDAQRGRFYDGNGNLTRICNGGTPIEMVYDYANRMVEYIDPARDVYERYRYDVQGRRIEVETLFADADDPSALPAGTRVRYFYDGWQVVEERIIQPGASGSSATVWATYVYGNYIDEVVQMQRDLNGDGVIDEHGTETFYYHTDDMYNVVAITNGLGEVVERYEYTDYGQPIVLTPEGSPRTTTTSGTSITSVDGAPISVIGNPYMFTGRRYDSATGLYHYRHRYYDPVIGRFTTIDPLGLWGDPGNTGNGYTYVANNPWSMLDPFGLCPPYANKPHRSKARSWTWGDVGHGAMSWIAQKASDPFGIRWAYERLMEWCHYRSLFRENGYGWWESLGRATAASLVSNVFAGNEILDAYSGYDAEGNRLTTAQRWWRGSIAVAVNAANVAGVLAVTGALGKAAPAGRGVPGKPWKALVEGKAHGTPPHRVRMYREAITMAKSGRYERIRLNKTLRTTTEGAVHSLLKPDVAGIRKGSRLLDLVEVPHPGQTAQQMWRKIQKMLESLAERAGRGKVEPIQ